MLIERILAELKDVGVRGDPVLGANGIEMHKGAVRIEVPEPESIERPEMAQVHAHVVARLIGSARETPLEACVVGIGADTESAEAQAAKIWLNLAGAPILSLLDGAEVMNADHFTGVEAWGVSGAHGFVGPVMARGGGVDMDALATAPLFARVPEAFPDALTTLPHLVKATLYGDTRWDLMLELDGHVASETFEDVDIGIELAGSPCIVTRYVLFSVPPA